MVVLTPAEESGLAGLRLSGRVQRATTRIAPARMVELVDLMRRDAAERHLLYLHEGVSEPIRILPSPITLRPDQLAYVHSVTLTLLDALKRLPEIYFRSPQVREALRLTPAEEQWFLECWGPTHMENNPMFGRLDAVVDFTSPMWKESLRFVEPNLSGIGGVHIAPTCDAILMRRMVPELGRIDPGLRLEPVPDMRELLVQELLDHLEVVGRPRGTVALLDPKYEQDGPDEQDWIARFLRERHGIVVVHADPSELSLRDGEVHHRDIRIDVGYRDYTVLDLIELASRGVDVEPVKTLFRQNRMISSIGADLDQKSCWEVMTDPSLAPQLFSAEERQVIRRHVLWTRLLSRRRTTNPEGCEVDLVEFAREEREALVLKPNRAFGGQGVLVGPSVSEEAWQSAVDTALGDAQRWVVQSLAALPVREFPVIGPNGQVGDEPFHYVMGFAATRYGVGIMARASQKQVVNVAQRGGLCAVLVGSEASPDPRPDPRPDPKLDPIPDPNPLAISPRAWSASGSPGTEAG